MTNHTITISLTQAGRAAALMAGQPAAAEQKLELHTALFARALALGGAVDSAGHLHLTAVRSSAFGRSVSDALVFDAHPVTAERALDHAEAAQSAALDLEAAEDARQEALNAERAVAARAADADRAALLASQTDEDLALWAFGQCCRRPSSYDLREKYGAGINARLGAINDRVDQLWAALDAELVAVRDGWIAEHGSETLRRCVAEKLECAAMVRSEYLAATFPGWILYAETPFPGESKAVRNPRPCAFELLDLARAVAPDAEIFYYCDPKREREGYCAEALVTVPGDANETRIALLTDASSWDI